MQLTIVGCAPACPNPGGASSGYLVQDQNTSLLLECGHGVSGQMQRYVALSDIDAILITHMHPDHFFDLVPLKYGFEFSGRKGVRLHLPPGGTSVLQGMETPDLLGDDFFTGPYSIAEFDADAGMTIGTLSVRFAPTRHAIPGWSVRIECAGSGSLFFSSDTAPSKAVEDLARGANLALLEATIPEPEKRPDPIHLTGTQAGELAATAGAHRLILTHYWQPLGARGKHDAEMAFQGSVELASPGAQFEL